MACASCIDTTELQRMLTDGLLVGSLDALEVSLLVITYFEANSLHLRTEFMCELLNLSRHLGVVAHKSAFSG